MHVPKYCKHPNGQAFVQYKRRRVYLGKHGTPQSIKNYRLFLERIENGEDPFKSAPMEPQTTFRDLINHYMKHLKDQRGSAKRESSRQAIIDEAMEQLLNACGDLDPNEFGPRLLLQLRQRLVGQDLTRVHINNLIKEIKELFAWCAARELLDPNRYAGLACVRSLRYGEGGRES